VGFDVTKCFPYDVMHTVFEGIAIQHLEALIKYMINDKHYLSLQQLNSIFRTCKYDPTESKPSPINKNTDGSYQIKQTGTIV
jgi:hypothetical protein